MNVGEVAWKRWMSASITELEPIARLLQALRALEGSFETLAPATIERIAAELGESPDYLRGLLRLLHDSLSGETIVLNKPSVIPAAVDFDPRTRDERHAAWMRALHAFAAALRDARAEFRPPHGEQAVMLGYWEFRVRAFADELLVAALREQTRNADLRLGPRKAYDLGEFGPDYELMRRWLIREHHRCLPGVTTWISLKQTSLNTAWRRFNKVTIPGNPRLHDADAAFRTAHAELSALLNPDGGTK